MLRWMLIPCLWCQSVLMAAAPEPVVIKGRVFDVQGTPLAFANVYLVETLEGTVTDRAGEFSFQTRARGPVTLRVTYMGFKPHESALRVAPGPSSPVRVTLKPEAVRGQKVTVTAGSFRADDEQGATLTAMDVVRTPGAAADLFMAIQALPGVQQAAEGAGLFVRGGDVSETAIFLDGALITHPYRYESPTGGFFGTFSPFLLKGSYFSSGGYGAQYGHGLSGVLAMESLDMPSRFTCGLGVGLAAESAFLSLPIVPGKAGINLSGNLSNTRMLFKVNGDLDRFTEPPGAHDLSANATVRLSGRWRLKLFHFLGGDRIGVRVEDPDHDPLFENDADNRFTHAVLRGALDGGWLITLGAGASRYSQSPRMGALDIDLTDRLLQGSVTIERLKNGRRLVIGAQRLLWRSAISGTRPLGEADANPDAPQVTVDTRYRSTRTALFASTELGLGPLTFIPGLRWSHEDLSGASVTDPRLSAVWTLPKGFRLTAAWGRYHQSPDPRYFDETVGNPGLGNLAAEHAVLGLGWERGETQVRVEAYNKWYHDLLLQESGYRYVNRGAGRARGVDIFVKSRYKTLSGWLSCSWLDAKRRWMDMPVWCPPDFAIPQTFTTVINWDATARLMVGGSLKAASGRPYTPSLGAYNATRTPAYVRVDLTLGYRTSLIGRDMTIFYASCNNVLGRRNILDYAYSDDYSRRVAVESAYGRSVYFGFQINFQ